MIPVMSEQMSTLVNCRPVFQDHSTTLGHQLLNPETRHETTLEAMETTNALWDIYLGAPLPGDFHLLHQQQPC